MLKLILTYRAGGDMISSKKKCARAICTRVHIALEFGLRLENTDLSKNMSTLYCALLWIGMTFMKLQKLPND